MNLFKKKKYIRMNPPETIPVSEIEVPSIPDGLWIKCHHCDKTIYTKEINEYKICPNCGYHFRLTAKERINLIADGNSFQEWDSNMQSKNPMAYPDYDNIIKKAQLKTELKDAVVTGCCKIGGYDAVLAVMDSHFMMASMGSVVGEKITRAIEKGTEKKLPVIIFTASGGARMQEGIISLMQMAKTSAALNRHSKAGLLYVSVITDPTTGGVSASFASLGDIILSEPNATIGFAGRRVIEGTINEKLPDEFQTAEFQLEHGFLDKIVNRVDMKSTLIQILKLHCQKEEI